MNSSDEDSDEDDPFNKKYIKLQKIAEGTYGIVWRAKNTETGRTVAIKVFKNIGNEGLPVSAVREVHILKKLKSPFVLQPLQLNIKPKMISMVTEWKQLSLNRLIKSTVGLDPRKIIRQIVKGVESIHDNYIIHRDLKPANIVLDDVDSLNLKIIDLGMAKEKKWGKNLDMTNEVGTLYYRAPELLQGATSYTSAIDVWAIGCIFYELLTREVLFKGDNEALQLIAIYEDTATQQQANLLVQQHPQQIMSIKLNSWARIQSCLEAKKSEPLGLDLLKKLVKIDPGQRITCKQALQHPYFLE